MYLNLWNNIETCYVVLEYLSANSSVDYGKKTNMNRALLKSSICFEQIMALYKPKGYFYKN